MLLILLVKIMLCGKLHCQKCLNLKHIAYKIGGEMAASAPLGAGRIGATCRIGERGGVFFDQQQ